MRKGSINTFEPNDSKLFKLINLKSYKEIKDTAKFSIADYGGTKGIIDEHLVECMTLLTYRVRFEDDKELV